jgi:hypothetical protein
MFRRIPTVCLLLPVVLVLSLSSTVCAQEDCAYGFKIYARDESGRAVENGSLEVKGASAGDFLPANVTRYVEKGGLYNISGLMGSTVKGNFIFVISAEGFETYRRRFNFPVCEIQTYELRLRPKGATAEAGFERLFTLHGKVFDEERKPFGNAQIEARSADGRTYQTTSNPYGYYQLALPKGVMRVRVSESRIADVVFDGYRMEKNYSVLNVPVCLKCKEKESLN